MDFTDSFLPSASPAHRRHRDRRGVPRARPACRGPWSSVGLGQRRSRDGSKKVEFGSGDRLPHPTTWRMNLESFLEGIPSVSPFLHFGIMAFVSRPHDLAWVWPQPHDTWNSTRSSAPSAEVGFCHHGGRQPGPDGPHRRSAALGGRCGWDGVGVLQWFNGSTATPRKKNTPTNAQASPRYRGLLRDGRSEPLARRCEEVNGKILQVSHEAVEAGSGS